MCGKSTTTVPLLHNDNQAALQLPDAFYEKLALQCDKAAFKHCTGVTKDYRDACATKNVYGKDPAGAETGRCALTFKLSRALESDSTIMSPEQLNLHLVRASYFGRTEVVRMLLDLPLERGVDPSSRNNDALRFASLRGRTEVVRMLLAQRGRGVEPSDDNNYALRVASREGHIEVVRLLLDEPAGPGGRGVEPSADNNGALRWASAYGHAEVVRMLLDEPTGPGGRGVDPSADDNYALRWASSFGHTEVVRMLLALPLWRGVAPVDVLLEAQRLARRNGRIEVVRMLLERLGVPPVDPLAA